jgi:hypothetical protein
MRPMIVILVGLVIGYYLGCFAAPLALVRGSAGGVNKALGKR